MQITLTVLDIILIFAAMFVLIEWRLTQVKRATIHTIVEGHRINNQAIEDLLNKKDEIFKEIFTRMNDEIFDGRDALRLDLMKEIDLLKEKQNSSNDV